MNLTFVESRVFSARWDERLGDESLRELQMFLMSNPARGVPIPGCPLLRKLRWGDPGRGKGKRGGLRIIYMHTPEARRIDLVTLYAKDERDDLTKDQLRVLCGLARQLREESIRSLRRNERE